MKKILLLFLSILLVLSFFSGCSPKSDANKDAKLKIVTTIFPLYDFVRAVGGDNVSVTMLIDPGTEVHSYDPTPTDINAIYTADLFFYIGGESDTWVSRILADCNTVSYSMLNSVQLLKEDGEEEYDEHIWTSPKNAISMIQYIADKLIELDTDNTEKYCKNHSEYISKIQEIQKDIQSSVSLSENKFIVVADRFPFKYLTEEFGIKYIAALGGCATSSDISIKKMSQLVSAVNENCLKYAFYIEMSNQDIALALSEETGVELLCLHSAHNVSRDDFINGITYVDIITLNSAALKEALK